MRILIFSLFCISLYATSEGMCPAVCQCRNGELICFNSGLSQDNISQLRSARHLSLVGNLVNCICPSALQLYTNLSVWDFQSKSAKVITFGSFYHLRNLVELQLGLNQDLNSTQDCQLFSEKPTVKTPERLFTGQLEKHVGGSTLKRIQKLSALKSLKILLSEDMQLKSLNMDAFKGLQRLQKLNLSGFSSFPDHIFKPLSSLVELILDNNQLWEIKDSDFNHLNELTLLSLSYNQISQIHPSAFRGLFKLEVLKLNKNHLSEIKKLTFQYFQNLREVDLSDNAISALEDLAFGGLSQLETLRLNNNRLFHLSPQVFGCGGVRLQALGLTGNEWKCDCGLVSLKSWLESGRMSLVTVKCSHPETLKGQYLHTISGALIRNRCSGAAVRVQSKPTHSGNGSRVTRQTCRDGDRYHARRRVGRTAPQLGSELGEEGNAQKTTLSRPGLVQLVAKPNLTSDPCSYNQLVILNISAMSITSSSALIQWNLAQTNLQNVHFRIMYDHFHTSTRFSRFVNVKQGTVCHLYDLRPSTPYLVCVESVLEEKVCHVASRDLCLGIMTEPEEMSTPEPQILILYLTGLNALAVLALLALVAHVGCVLRRKRQADALSLFYSRDKSVSCATCAGIPLSDRNSGMNTTSSHTGTYQHNDAIDVIDLPAGH